MIGLRHNSEWSKTGCFVGVLRGIEGVLVKTSLFEVFIKLLTVSFIEGGQIFSSSYKS